MNSFQEEELQSALKIVSSTIKNCEKMQLKFQEGTSQFSLLRNRIKALKISKYLITNDDNITTYTKNELEDALSPIISIIHKTEKAQGKFDKGSTHYRRFSALIEAMYICKSLIAQEISNRR